MVYKPPGNDEIVGGARESARAGFGFEFPSEDAPDGQTFTAARAAGGGTQRPEQMGQASDDPVQSTLQQFETSDYLLDAYGKAEEHLAAVMTAPEEEKPASAEEAHTRFLAGVQPLIDGAPDDATRETLGARIDGIWAERGAPLAVGDEIGRRQVRRVRSAENVLAHHQEMAARYPALIPGLTAQADATLDLLKGLGVSEQGVERRKQEFRAELRDTALTTWAEDSPRAAKQRLEAGEFDELFGPDETGRAERTQWLGRLTQQAMAADEDAALARAAAEQREAEAQNLGAATFSGTYRAAISRGEARSLDIARARQAGLIDDAEAERLRQQRLASDTQRKAQAAARNDLVTQIRAGGQPDLGDGDTREAMESWYAADMAPAWAQLPEEDRRDLEKDFVREYRFVPRGLAKTMRRALNGGDPEIVVATAQSLEEMLSENPDLVESLGQVMPEAELNRARAIGQLIDAGHPTERVLDAVGPAPLVVAQKPADEGSTDDSTSSDVSPDEGNPDAPPEETGSSEPPPEAEAPEDPQLEDGAAADGSEVDDGNIEASSDTPEPEDEPDHPLLQLADEADSLLAAHGGKLPPAVKKVLGNKVIQIIAELAPGTGNVIDGIDAYNAFVAAKAALENDDLAEALMKGGEGLLHGAFAVPGLGNLAKLGGKAIEGAAFMLPILRASSRAGRRASRFVKQAGDRFSHTDIMRLGQDVQKETLSSRYVHRSPVGGARANDEFAKKIFGKNADASHPDFQPPYRVDTPVYDAILSRESKGEFVRVFPEGRYPKSEWIMLRSDYEAALKEGGPAKLKEIFALDKEPAFVVPVTLPAKTRVRVGIAGPHKTHGTGGAMQYQIQSEFKEDWFGEPQRISQ